MISMIDICAVWELAQPLTRKTCTNTAISPSQEIIMMKMTPVGLSGLCGRHRNQLNDKPIVVNLCDSASPRGSSPVGSESEGIIMHVQTKQSLPCAPSVLFRALWLLIYLTTARWCFEIVCPCTHSFPMDLCLLAVYCMEVPDFPEEIGRAHV